MTAIGLGVFDLMTLGLPLCHGLTCNCDTSGMLGDITGLLTDLSTSFHLRPLQG